MAKLNGNHYIWTSPTTYTSPPIPVENVMVTGRCQKLTEFIPQTGFTIPELLAIQFWNLSALKE